jgi:hypothetical protein
MYDGRIGRWLSVDPAGQFDSPYEGMGNDPVSGNDPTGGFDYDTEEAAQQAAIALGVDPSTVYNSGGKSGWGFNTISNGGVVGHFGATSPPINGTTYSVTTEVPNTKRVLVNNFFITVEKVGTATVDHGEPGTIFNDNYNFNKDGLSIEHSIFGAGGGLGTDGGHLFISPGKSNYALGATGQGDITWDSSVGGQGQSTTITIHYKNLGAMAVIMVSTPVNLLKQAYNNAGDWVNKVAPNPPGWTGPAPVIVTLIQNIFKTDPAL